MNPKLTSDSPLDQALVDLTQMVVVADVNAAAQLDELKQALQSGRLEAWLGVNLFHVFNLDNLRERISTPPWWRQEAMRWLEVIRNILVLLPLTFTWLALGVAAINYKVATSPPNPPTDESFLALWERGFDGLGQFDLPFVHTFSQLAFGDAILLIVLIVVTLFLFAWRSVENMWAERVSQRFLPLAESTLGQINRILFQEQYQHTGQTLTRFQEHAQELVKHLDRQQTLANDLVQRREQEAMELTKAARELKEGVTPLPEFASRVAEASHTFANTSQSFLEQVSKVHQQQQSLTHALQTTNDNLKHLTDNLGQIHNQGQLAIRQLQTVTEQHLQNMDGVTNSAQHLGSLSTDLLQRHEDLRMIWVDEHQAHQTVAQELVTASRYVAAVTEQLDNAMSRLERIQNHLATTMHLSAQISDDHGQRDQQLDNLVQNLRQIAGNIQASLDRLEIVDQQALQVTRNITQMGEQLSGVWEKGFESWLQQMEEVTTRTSGMLGAQGVSLKQASELFRESIQKLERDYSTRLASLEKTAQSMAQNSQQLERVSHQLDSLLVVLRPSDDGQSGLPATLHAVHPVVAKTNSVEEDG